MSLVSTIKTALFKTRRKIGSFTAQVTVVEDHEDDLTITSHPIERGAAVSDHAFKEPARLNLVVGWSNSTDTSVGTRILTAIKGDILGAVEMNYARDMYEKFLALQATREPFTVTTGKRVYRNMLIASLATTTDKETENALILRIGLRETLIVQTRSTTVPPREVQAFPEKTADVVNSGTKQAIPAKNANVTALKSASGLVRSLFGG